MSTTLSMRIDQNQVDAFNREGYMLFKEPVFPVEKFNRLKAHFEDKLNALPEDSRPEQMDVPHFTDPALFEWLLSDEVLDIVEPILGPDIALFSSHFICKPQGDGRRVPWHEDSFYWSKMMAPEDMRVVTIWLAIDESTEENGCMKVIPGSWGGYSDYDPVDPQKHVFNIEIKPHLRDESKAVSCVLEPNQASLHESHIMHASEPNFSQNRRCGYTMRYISTKTRLMEESRKYHQIYLARGRDLGGNVYGDPAKLNQELIEGRFGKNHKVH